jgi:hypothetical protein
MNELPATRRYDEKEVRRLLERAAELQGAAPAARPQTGLTLRELEEIATEAGLDVTSVRQAALELDAGPEPGLRGAGRTLAGGPLKTTLEHTVPNDLDPAAFADLLPLIQRAADVPGHASQVGRSLSWSSQNPSNLRQLQVMLTARDGATHIWIEERYSGLAGAVFGGGLGGIGGGIGGGMGGALGGALGSAALGVGIPIVVITATYAVCRKVFGDVVRRRRRVLEQLLHDLVTRLSS